MDKTRQTMIDTNSITQIMSPFDLGLLFEKGGHVPCDKAKAADCYRLASKTGDARAMYRLALLEMKKEPLANAALMRKAARLGNNDAAWWLANQLFHGVILPNDYDEAFFWLKELSFRDGLIPRSEFLMGQCYYNGYGTAVDYKAAVRMLFKALESSGRDKWGSVVSHSTDTQESRIKELSDADIRAICRIMGECHYYGRGVDRDWSKALKYLLLAVQDENYLYPDKDVEYLIGTCYYFHRGTRQDIPTALYWLTDAEQRGSMEAKQLLERRARRREGRIK